ncbi:MAG: response regulator [Chloroflexota bacterium]
MPKKIRVLIVEDSLDMRAILQSSLYYLAPDVEVIAAATDGFQGIRMTKHFQPDVVLMDVNLPGIDGISATMTLQKETPRSKVILMSGEMEPDHLQRSRIAGAHHVFTKPIDCDALISTIRTLHAN